MGAAIFGKSLLGVKVIIDLTEDQEHFTGTPQVVVIEKRPRFRIEIGVARVLKSGRI